MKSIKFAFSSFPLAFRPTRQAFINASLALLLLCPVGAIAGDREGNGGDDLRANFIRMGGAVIRYLTSTSEGRSVVRRYNLDTDAMANYLHAEKILVVDGELKDNGGSIVDARFQGGIIELHKLTWWKHFEGKADVYYLVAHELFRATKEKGFDEDYVVSSKELYPFHPEFKVKTRIRPEYPLLRGELLRSVLDSEKLIFNGSGCPTNTAGTYVDFDYETNVINISMHELGSVVGKVVNETSSRKVCMLNFPIVIPKKKRLLVTQMDATTQLGLPAGSSMRIRTEVYLSGRRGKVFEKVVQPGNYTFGKTLIRENDVLQSDCGEASHLLNIATSIQLDGDSWLPSISNSTRQALYLKLVDCE